MERQL